MFYITQKTHPTLVLLNFSCSKYARRLVHIHFCMISGSKDMSKTACIIFLALNISEGWDISYFNPFPYDISIPIIQQQQVGVKGDMFQFQTLFCTTWESRNIRKTILGISFQDTRLSDS